jgi:hypothetical protein
LLLVRGLHQRHEGAWFVEVVGGAFGAQLVVAAGLGEALCVQVAVGRPLLALLAGRFLARG